MADIGKRIHNSESDTVEKIGNPKFKGKEIVIGIKDPQLGGGCKYRIVVDHDDNKEYEIKFEKLSRSESYNGAIEEINYSSEFSELVNERYTVCTISG